MVMPWKPKERGNEAHRNVACLHSSKFVVNRAADLSLCLPDKILSHRGHARALLAALTHQIQVCG